MRKGEKGSLVVYANTITRTEQDEATGEETERDIPFMKGYTVFNAEQIEGLPAHFYPSRPGRCGRCCGSPDPATRKPCRNAMLPILFVLWTLRRYSGTGVPIAPGAMPKPR